MSLHVFPYSPATVDEPPQPGFPPYGDTFVGSGSLAGRTATGLNGGWEWIQTFGDVMAIQGQSPNVVGPISTADGGVLTPVLTSVTDQWVEAITTDVQGLGDTVQCAICVNYSGISRLSYALGQFGTSLYVARRDATVMSYFNLGTPTPYTPGDRVALHIAADNTLTLHVNDAVADSWDATTIGARSNGEFAGILSGGSSGYENQGIWGDFRANAGAYPP